MDLKRSRQIFKRAEEVMVGGVNSPVRSFRAVGGQPLVMQSGQGSRLTDLDGNSYTDYCLSWGALILGHAHPDVLAAVKDRIRFGTSYGTTTVPEAELAAMIVKRVRSVEQIRFVSSGTEATMSAIRLARGFTGREKIIKFDGCYHGHFDDLLTKAGSGVAQLKESSSLGITKNHIVNTISLPYNNSHLLEEVVLQHGREIACVIIEPVAGNMGVVPAEISFLKKLRELTARFKILLIFDEVMSGFRTNAGCAQTQLGIIPDLTCFGKIIGGGFPVGAYGGGKEIMSHLAPLGGVYQAGTFSGNPMVMAAGIATLPYLNASFFKKLNSQSDFFAGELNGFFQKNGLPARMDSFGSMLSLRFNARPVRDYSEATAASSQQLYSKLFHHLLENQIYFPPADLEAFFISSAHSKKDLQHLSSTLKDFFLTHPDHRRSI